MSRRRPGATGAPPALPAAAAVPGRHPVMVAAALVAFGCIAVSVTFPIFETDFWQHLLVGRVIWSTHGVPRENLWTWPTWGAAQVLPSWGFRALLWPFWQLGGVSGLFAWRWLTTLAAFAIAWAAARRMGARGFAPLVALVLCALVYRQRSQVRPETLVAVLLALEIWVLETHRRRDGGRRDPAPWLVAIAWVWANVHLSYAIGLALIAIHALSEALAGRSRAPRPRRALLPVLLAAVAVSFLNPFGWRALWEPFEYFLTQRHEPIFRNIGELGPVVWGLNWRNGLPLLLVGWPLLVVRRWRRDGFDAAEALTCALFTTLGLSSQRFVGFYALAAAPYLARGLEGWRPPAWARAPAVRAALAAAVCLAVSVNEWTHSEMRPGIGIEMSSYPVAACDFMAREGVRGQGFNSYPYGGYLLWRFWPERGRLPFMDIHQTGTRDIRLLTALAASDPAAWRELDRRYRFDWLLLQRVQVPGDRLLDVLDADSTWSLVFLDDAAALYARRAGALEPLARRFGYRLLPAGGARLEPLSAAWERDPVLRRALLGELRRQAEASPWNASAWNLAGYIANLEGRPSAARAAFERAIAVNERLVPGAHDMLGRIALREGRPRDALREFQAERALSGSIPGLDYRVGVAWRMLGDGGRARTAWRRELARNPGHEDARDSLAALERGAR